MKEEQKPALQQTDVSTRYFFVCTMGKNPNGTANGVGTFSIIKLAGPVTILSLGITFSFWALIQK